MQNIKRAAFIKYGDFSHINTSLLDILRKNFPNYQIDVVDVKAELFAKKDAKSLYHCFMLYGKEILQGKKNISSTFLRTPYAFSSIKEGIYRKLANQNYSFTFQTQSLFDASLPRTPHFLYTDHTHLANLKYPGFDPQNLFAEPWIECEKHIYQNATLNFTMSTNISQSINEDYDCDLEKIACVYCGANVEVAENEVFDDDRYAAQNILFVGVDWERKGGSALENAFRIVLNTYPQATLTIVGCSPELDLPNCNIVGKVPLSEVKKYFRQASIFCLPTNLEPFGIVFLEAMAHKLPIIGSNIGAIPDFIDEGENGYMVEPNNPEQLARKIMQLIGSPEKCRNFGEHGHKLFWERYTWEKTGVRIRENMTKFLMS